MLKGQKKYYALITLFRTGVNVYFGQFLVFYFFTVANYDIFPIALYYLFEYAFLGVGFFIIRHAMKSNNGMNYYRIGIALTALYLAMIMLLKENIIHYAILVGFIRGLSEGFYYFNHNTMYTYLVKNEERKRYAGIISMINNIISIVLPLIVGYCLTYFSYTEIAKVVFVFMVLSFFLTYGIEEKAYYPQKCDLKGFWHQIRKTPILQNVFATNFFAGLTFSSGALSLVVTIFTIFEFKTNLNLGIISSVFAVFTCLTCYLFGLKMKEKSFRKTMIVSLILYIGSIILFALFPGKSTIIFYNLCNAICLTIITLIFDLIFNNLSNETCVGEKFKVEYYLMNDIIYGISRTISYCVVLVLVFVLGIEILQWTFLFFAFFLLCYGICALKIFQK